MGQKVNPKGFRLGVTETSDSVWYDFENYSDKVYEDYIIRNFIKRNLIELQYLQFKLKENLTI